MTSRFTNRTFWDSVGLLLFTAVILWQGVLAAAPAPKVVASNKPLHSLVAGLMQGVAEPVLVLDGESAPWLQDPDAEGKRAILEADLVVWSGKELEPTLAPLFSQLNSQTEVFEVLATDLIKVLPARHDDDLRDPFFWLDTRNMLILLDALAERLVQIDPGRASIYDRNWKRLSAELGEVDRTLEFGYRDVSGVPVYFFHDTHQYFEQAYAMRVDGSVKPAFSGSMVDSSRLLLLRNRLAEVGNTCLFTELGLSEPHLDVLLAGTAIEPVELDSLGVGLEPGPALYKQLMTKNFEAIARCVKALSPESVTPIAQRFPVPDVRRFPDQIRPRYAMQDQYGRMVSVDDFRGKLQVIFFGYTFCPDICPTALATLAQALDLLGEDANEIQPIFITVDPQRDSPSHLAEYVEYFHPRLLALSGSPEATKRIAELFRARYEFVSSESGNSDWYSMDHTASLYVLGRNGEFLTKFAHGLPAREMAEQLRQHIGG